MCGVSVRSYEKWVKAGRVPGFVAGTRRHKIADVRAAIINMDGAVAAQGASLSALERWKVSHGADQAQGRRQSHQAAR